ncbi:MAG: phospho-sugar mutase [Actinobacteria bacterium]|nr:phospho-sugar mutase [Actinomycetota bacterium]
MSSPDDAESTRVRLRSLLAKAESWLAIDPDPATRASLHAMVERTIHDGNPDELLDHLGTRLSFGTAGLRGEMGPGSNRLNRLMARQTAAGLAVALIDHGHDASRRGILVGHDARHHSAVFARDIVSVLVAAGVPCQLVEGTTPTPLIAWGVRHLGAAAGVVVTASHNPAKDNGIKIYWADGAQIIPPVDGWIADAIAANAGINPAGSDADPALAPASLTDDYVAMVTDLVGPAAAATGDRSSTVIASTAMHGVGAALLKRCLAAAGFGQVTFVAEQEQPDPDFPTVPFPNPEEAGATDLLVALAERIEADVAIANDPDADRVAVAIRGTDGAFRLLTGDELGALFAAGLLERRGAGDGRTPLLVTTVVSSQLLASIAASVGAVFVETLTGFKWLCRPGFEHPELDQVLAYEESIGYAVGGLCDKDGISAATVFCDLVTGWKASGRTPQRVLDELAVAHGAHVTNNFSIRVGGVGWAERLAAAVASFVAAPPTHLAGVSVDRLDQPADDVIRLFLANGDRAVIRPSGTEPKLKCYIEAVEPAASLEAADAARATARSRTVAVAEDLRARFSL